MVGRVTTSRANGTHPLRLSAWGGAVTLLALPAVAMQFTREVMWTPSDFGVFAAMLGAALGGFEFLQRRGDTIRYRLGAATALGAAFLLVWIDLAVGFVGTEDAPANALFIAVPLIGVGAAVIGRFRPTGMARALVATAVAQMAAGVAGVALVGVDRPLVGLTLMFTALWLIAAGLFVKAAR